MALPYLIKHIHNNGTDEVIRRGKRIHSMGNVELVEFDDLMGNVVMRVKDDGYATYYKITTYLKFAATKPEHFFNCKICWIKICSEIKSWNTINDIQWLK